MTERRVRCLICDRLVYSLPTLQDAFVARRIRIGNRSGCICTECVYSLYNENADIYDQKDEMLLASAQNAAAKPNLKKHESKVTYSIEYAEDGEVLEGFKEYPCLNLPMDFFIENVKKKVRGQDEAVTKMVYTLYHNQMCNMLEDGGFESPSHEHILLIGSTGIGKTYIAENVLKVMNIPYARSTAEAITAAGYVGGKVEDVVERLYAAADYDIEKAQKGVVIIDEIDKKRRNFGESHDVNGLAVQQELLKLLEPSTVWIHDKNSINLHSHDLPFDTTNLTIILCGAFVGLKEMVEARIRKREIGFTTRDESPIDFLANVEPRDFVEYGFIEEFVGRMPTPTILKPLDKKTLLDIIYDELLNQTSLFKNMGFTLCVSDIVLDTIADRVIAHNTGARDVKKELESLLYNAKKIVLESAPEGVCNINENGDTEALRKRGKKEEIVRFPGAKYLKYTDE